MMSKSIYGEHQHKGTAWKASQNSKIPRYLVLVWYEWFAKRPYAGRRALPLDPMRGSRFIVALRSMGVLVVGA